MKQALKYTAILYLFNISGIVDASAGTSMEQHFKTLYEAQSISPSSSAGDQDRRKAIVGDYEQFFSPIQERSNLAKITVDDLELIFRAAKLAAFYSHEERYALHARQDLDELEKRHAASDKDYVDMYKTYVLVRMFANAEQLRRYHLAPGMAPLPAFQKATAVVIGKPSNWVIPDHGNSLNLQAVNLVGRHIVVVAHPLCHFSSNAVHEIHEHPELISVLEHYAVWIAPPEQTFDVATFQQWNADNSWAAMGVVNRERDWPMLNDWATPVFYFIKDGKVEKKLVGWPPTGGLDRLKSAMRDTGYMP